MNQELHRCFLNTCNSKEQVLIWLKKDVLPTLKKALENPSTTTSGKTRDSTVRRQQRKVITFISIHVWKSA